MIWIIGGTAETGQFLRKLGDRRDYLVTVATDSGKEALPAHVPVIVGRMDVAQMRRFIQERGMTAIVDLSHPYAVNVSRNARQAAKECGGMPYFRYVRERTASDHAMRVASLQECLAFLRSLTGACVFLTTGSTHIGEFQAVRGDNRFVYRVLPTVASLEICERHQLAMQDIVAALGPFSETLNVAMFREYGAAYVVMKDSGLTGGTPDKLRACATLGITGIIIGRSQEDGFDSLDAIFENLGRY